MARFTTSGAASGADARPERKSALFPATVGPDKGNGEADDDEASTAKKAAPNKAFRIREYTRGYKSACYARILAIERRKVRSTRSFARFGNVCFKATIRMPGEDGVIEFMEIMEQCMLYRTIEFGP